MTDPFPLRMASPEAFRVVLDFLRGSGYTEEFLLSHFQISGLHLLLAPLGISGRHLGLKYQGEGMPLFLARTLMAGFPTTPEEISHHLPWHVAAAFAELGILQPAPDKTPRPVAPVLIYPSKGFFVAADRGFWSEGPGYRGRDFVMCGMEDMSTRYLDGISKSPCGKFLELGTGAGFASLVATEFADHVWSTDITERAVSFAEFNRQLNGVTNMKVMRGDLFAPVAGMRFDRIAAHPPFEPALKKDYVFSVGGEDGEAIIARIVAGAPAHLEPGGRLYCQVTATDRYQERFEERVVKWLGMAAEEYDVALFVRLACKPMEYATNQVLAENADSWKLQEWTVLYQNLQAEQVIVGQLVLQRRTGLRPVFRVRRAFGPRTGSREMEWLLDLETRFVEPGFAGWLLEQKPVCGENWELYVRHSMKNGPMAPFSHTFFSTHPFESNIHCAPWMPILVGRCDGTKTLSDHLTWLQTRVPLKEEDLLQAAAALISSDILRLPAEVS